MSSENPSKVLTVMGAIARWPADRRRSRDLRWHVGSSLKCTQRAGAAACFAVSTTAFGLVFQSAIHK